MSGKQRRALLARMPVPSPVQIPDTRQTHTGEVRINGVLYQYTVTEYRKETKSLIKHKQRATLQAR